MLAFLQYLFALLILEYADSGGVAPARPDGVGIVLTVVAFALAMRVGGVTIARASPRGGARGVGGLLLSGTAARVAALAVFYVIVVPLGGARIPAALGISSWVLVPRLAQFVPYFALVAGMTWGLHPASAALRVGATTAARAVADELRNAPLSLAPVLALVTFGDLTSRIPPTSSAGIAYRIFQQQPALQAFGSVAIVFCVLLVLPFGMRLFIRAKPLPDGTLRRRLEAYSRRIGFRYRDIVVWPTDVLNAAVLGALPRFRYVLVTDALLATLSEDEIEAVFAHEAGHARRGHVLMFFGFTSVLGLIGFVPGVADVLLAPFAAYPLLRVLVLVGAWFGVVFGWVSRRFEQEADVFGIETLPMADPSADPATHPFARAMERLGNEVGAIREVTGWRHFSIADRVEFVRRYLSDEAVRRSHRRSILLLRGTLLVVICGFALGAAAQVPGEIQRAVAQWKSRAAPEGLVLELLHDALLAPTPGRRAERFVDAAAAAAYAGRPDDAVRWLRESVALGEHDPEVLVRYAETLEQTGRAAGARLVWEEIAADENAAEDVREPARKRALAPGSR